MSGFMEICERAARAGGQVLLDWQDRFNATQKGPRDLVTEADLASQETIRELILTAYPGHQFLGEEDLPASGSSLDESHSASTSPYRWIVDPLDGTTNYVHKLQSFATSVALEKDGQPLVGVIYDPVADECYSAERGQGAYLNGRRIKPSDCSQMNEALVAASLPARVPRNSIEIARMVEVIHDCQALRRLGSAALNLCYLAAGRLDAYWAASVKIWDVAAGVLVVEEAGGVVSALDGGEFQLERPQFAAAATTSLHEQLVKVLKRAEDVEYTMSPATKNN